MIRESPVRILGGVDLPGTGRVTLQRALAAYILHDSADAQRIWRICSSIAAHSYSSGRNVWYRVPIAAGRFEYFCLDPAEHRTSPPESAVVHDAPDGDGEITIEDILRAALAALPTGERTDATGKLADAAESALSGNPPAAARNRLIEFARIAEVGERESYDTGMNRLYTEYLANMDMAIWPFTCSVLLIQLQSCLGHWVQEDSTENPNAYLNSFADAVWADESLRATFRKAVEMIAEAAFNSARSVMREALHVATMSTFTPRLVLACHQYWCATWLSRYLAKTANSTGLRCGVLAEEGVACAISGLDFGALYCVRHPDDLPRWFLAAAGDQDMNVESVCASKVSNQISPVFPRSFAKVLAGHALTLGVADETRQGIAALNNLRTDFEHGTGEDCEFEIAWIDRALMHAYKKVGDEQNALGAAARISSRALLGGL